MRAHAAAESSRLIQIKPHVAEAVYITHQEFVGLSPDKLLMQNRGSRIAEEDNRYANLPALFPKFDRLSSVY